MVHYTKVNEKPKAPTGCENQGKRVPAIFYRTEEGGEPVREWLKGEVRTSLAQNRIARVLFYIDRKTRMVLLHGFIKETQKTPQEELELARSNKNKHQLGLK